MRVGSRRTLGIIPGLVSVLVLCGSVGGAAAADRGRAASASVSGQVSGPGGALLPAVVLTLAPLAGTASGDRAGVGEEPQPAPATTTSGERGVFRFVNLRPGSYLLAAESPGFEPLRAQVTALAPGESRTLPLALALATIRESILVSAETPRDSLEAGAIRESPARDVGEALGSTAGVFKLRKGGIASDVVVRGLQRGDLGVLIDGQRVHGACPNRMDPAAFHVDVAEVDRVEVGKGPFDVRYAGGLGGVVNVVTRRPERGWHVAPTLAAGSYGHVNPSLTASWAGERLSALAGYSYRQSDSHLDGRGTRVTELANYQKEAQERDAYRAGTAWAGLGWRPARNHALRLGWTRQAADDVLYPYLMMDAVYDDTDRASLAYEMVGTGRFRSLTAQAYFTRVEHWMTDQFRTSGLGTPRAWSMGTQAETETWGGRIETRLAGGLGFGLEAFRARWSSQTQLAGMQYTAQATIPDVASDTVGLFADWTRSLGNGLTLGAGARVDHVRAQADEARASTDLAYAYHGTRDTSWNGWLPSGKLRLAWKAAGGVELAATLGHAQRAPEANERFFALKRKGTDWVGRPDLEPARNTGVDVSASWQRKGLLVSASLFENRVADYISVAPAARLNTVMGVMNSSARTWANVDATLRGGELAVVVPFAGRLFASGDLSYVRGTKDAERRAGITDRDLAEMPPLRVRTGLRYDDGRFYAAVEGVFSASQRHVDSALAEEATGGWAVANALAGLRYRRLVVTVGVSNPLDRHYVEHLSYQRDPFRSGVRVPEPGRSLFANASFRF